MFQKIINFIKYHNAMAIGISLVLTLSLSVMASEGVRNTVLGEKIETVKGIDNSQLLTTDLESFDLELTIISITEDSQNYYINYQFKTLAIKDHVWQPVFKKQQMVVEKAGLAGRDLGLYVQEELGEVADYEISYLTEVQTTGKRKGKTEIVKTIEYTGLIGLVLDIKNKVLPGYEPVVKLPDIEIAQVSEPLIEPSEQFAAEPVLIEEESDVINPEVIENSSVPPNDPPNTIIVVHPPEIITLTEAIFEAIFTFHSSDQDATFQCMINSWDWQNCTSPKTYSGLLPGDYTFQVFATDLQGIYDTTPAVFSWTILEEEVLTDTAETPMSTTTQPTATSTEQVATSTEQVATSTDEIVTIIHECQPQLFYLDLDNDGYGNPSNTTSTCEQLINYVIDNTDCDDTNSDINPAVLEVCDSIDNNCDGQIDETCQDELIISTSTDQIVTSTDQTQ